MGKKEIKISKRTETSLISSKKSLKIFKSKDLIQTNISNDLMVLRLFIATVTRVKSGDIPDCEYTMNVSDVRKFYPSSERFYEYLERALSEIIKTNFILYDDKNSKFMTLFDYIERVGSSLLKFRFSSAIFPHILNFKIPKKQYVGLDPLALCRIASPYVFKLYELFQIKSYPYTGFEPLEFSLSMIYDLLGLDEESTLKKWNNFKNKVLIPAQRTFVEEFEKSFIYEPVKTGRSVTGIRITPYLSKDSIFDFVRNNQKQIVSYYDKRKAVLNCRKLNPTCPRYKIKYPYCDFCILDGLKF